MIDPNRRNHTAIQDVIDGVPSVPIDDFGIDGEGPLSDEQTHTVDVAETLCPLLDSMKESFLNSLYDTVDISAAVTV